MIERRKHRRIITLKNSAVAIFVALAALAAINIASEVRAPRGNIYGRIAPPPPPPPRTATHAPDVPVVSESEAPPTTVIPSESEGPASVGGTMLLPPSNPATVQPSNPSTKIAIVGDSSGVAIVSSKHRLRGGFVPQ